MRGTNCTENLYGTVTANFIKFYIVLLNGREFNVENVMINDVLRICVRTSLEFRVWLIEMELCPVSSLSIIFVIPSSHSFLVCTLAIRYSQVYGRCDVASTSIWTELCKCRLYSKYYKMK